jgi:hypothetical protein
MNDEMSNFWSKDTGLPVVIWVSVKTGAKHGARIKISHNKKWIAGDDFSLTISDNPKIVSGECKLDSKPLELIKKYIKLNKRVLIEYWNEKISTADLVKKLIKITT